MTATFKCPVYMDSKGFSCMVTPLSSPTREASFNQPTSDRLIQGAWRRGDSLRAVSVRAGRVVEHMVSNIRRTSEAN